MTIPGHPDQTIPDPPHAARDADKPCVFISHRHRDEHIANIIRDFLVTRTGGRVRVFQSYYVGSGPSVGDLLTNELGNELSSAEVVFLVYTVADENWSYCMWECGVAFDPKQSNTRIVVLQCARDIPAPLADRVSDQLTDKEHVKRFVVQLLTKEDFFPKYNRAITGFNPDDPTVLRAGEDLFASLAIEDKPDIQSWSWPWMRLEMDFDCEQRIGYLAEIEDHEQIRDLIAKHAEIVKHDPKIPGIFGMADFPEQCSIHDIMKNWDRNVTAGTSPEWSCCLLDQVARAITWQQPKADWRLVKHVDDEKWYSPILFRVRKMPRGRKFEFDVLFPRIYNDWKAIF